MTVTREMVVEKVTAYLHHDMSLATLVDWAESTMMEGDFQGETANETRDVVARLGVADVRAFGLTWEDCECLLKELGCTVRLEIGTEA